MDRRPFHFRPGGRLATLAAVVLSLSAYALHGWNGQASVPGGVIGESRLVSYDAVEQSGLCLTPTRPLLRASSRARAFNQPTARRVIDDPLRIIQDPYASLSSVAVDTTRNEVVATDENKFQILVYDRQADTPPTAVMTEPKRIISGSRTLIEFQCGLYIDQKTGDIYGVNNDTQNTLGIFSRNSEGNAPPDRWLTTPHGTFGIAVDEEHQELFLTVQHSSAVVTFRKTASGDEPPIRLLQGSRTRLADPHGIAFDAESGLMFVANYGSTRDFKAPPEQIGRLIPNWPLENEHAVPGSGRFLPPAITVYPRMADGNTPPLRTIEGPKTQLNWPTGLAFHSERNELFVTNDTTNSVLVFDGDAQGNAAPIRVLIGAKTGIENPTGVYLDTRNNELWVSNFGGHSLTVYDIVADGNVAPRRKIRTAPPDEPSLMIGNPGALAYDSKREEILVPN